MSALKPGTEYRHFKGGLYTLVGECFSTNVLGGEGGRHKLIGIAKDAETQKEYAFFSRDGDARLRVFSEDHNVWDTLVVYKGNDSSHCVFWIRTKSNFLSGMPEERGGGRRFTEVVPSSSVRLGHTCDESCPTGKLG